MLLDHATFDRARTQGDAAADALVDEVYGHGKSALAELNTVLRHLDRNHDELPADMPAPLRSFLEQGRDIGRAEGGWDEAKLREGAELYRNYCVHIPFILQFATMPTLYGCQHGTAVLTFTERLEKNAHRRSLETAQMVYDTMDPVGFLPHGRGWRSTQKVRLMHAAVRHFIRSSGRWDEGFHGVPINQEDLVGTLSAFSITVLDGLQRLGAHFTKGEAEAYWYRWTAIGRLMGIDPNLIAPDLDEARRNYRLSLDRQVAPSEAGRRLTRAWILAQREMIPSHHFHELIGPAIAYMVEPDVAAALDLHPSPDLAAAFAREVAHLQTFDRFSCHGSFLRKGLNTLANGVFQTLYVADRGLSRHSFELPDAIAHRWHVDGDAPAKGEGVSNAFHDFAERLGPAQRDVLFASVPRLLSMVAYGGGAFHLVERHALRKVLDHEVQAELGDDFRWSYAAHAAAADLFEHVPRPDDGADRLRLEELAAVVAAMPSDLRYVYTRAVERLCLHVAEGSEARHWFGAPVTAAKQRKLDEIRSVLEAHAG